MKTLREILGYLAYLAAVTLFAVVFASAWHGLLVGLDFHKASREHGRKRVRRDPPHYVMLDCR